MTFVLFYQMVRGDWRALSINTEFRWYVGFMLFFCGMVSWILWKENTYGLMDSIRYGTFQVTSSVDHHRLYHRRLRTMAPGRPDVPLCRLLYRRLCRLDHQRHQDGPLCDPVQIHVGRHQENFLSAHDRHLGPPEPTPGRLRHHRPGRLLFHRQHFHGPGRRLFHGAGRRHGLRDRHEFGHRHPHEHRTGFR